MQNDSSSANLADARQELEDFARSSEQLFTNKLPRTVSDGFGRMSRDLRSNLQKNQAILDDFAGSIGAAFRGSAKGVLNGVASNLLNQAIFQPLQQGLVAPLSQSISGFVGGLFGGARAGGGPVQTGRAYMVGERGPELFVPPQSGSIIPNGGGNNVRAPIVNVHIQAADPQAFHQSRAQIQAAIAGAVRQGL